MNRRVQGLTAALALTLLVACGGGGGGGGAAPGGGGPNGAPVFSSAATSSVAEKTTGVFYTAAATDPDGQAVTFLVSGGADGALFSITPGGGLSFRAAPDFEAPADANRDNLYLVTLGASDTIATTTLALTVTVTDVAGALVVRRVGTGFNQPLFVAGFGDNSGRVLVVEKGGLIRILDPATGATAATPFLDVSTQISTAGESGLLGMVLAPDFATSRAFYVHVVNVSGNTEIRRYVTMAGDPTRADPASADIILTATQPATTNHKGGWLGFGQDGFLYIALGDGGGAGDPLGNGQNRNVLLGKMLRVDPRTDAFPADSARDYAIPAGNPFASAGGLPEIFSFGLRNPFRASFDRLTGNLFIGDVGQGAVEEIDLVRTTGDAGLNFGWNILEGTSTFAGGSTVGLTPPVAQYPHGSGALQGNSVTGGYVYRGPIVAFRGQYVFGDFINARVWTIPVASFAQGTTIANTAFTDRTAAFVPNIGAIGNISSFGEDDAGNLFIVDIDGEIFVLREAD